MADTERDVVLQKLQKLYALHSDGKDVNAFYDEWANHYDVRTVVILPIIKYNL